MNTQYITAMHPATPMESTIFASKAITTRGTFAKVAAAFALAGVLGSAHADGVVPICVASGPAIPACVAVGVVIHEAIQALNGKDAFGPNGEGMKILHGIGGLFGGGGSDPKDPIVPIRVQRMRN